MRASQTALLLCTLGVLMAGCGGGGNETPVSFDPVPPAVSEYDRQTKAARAQFEQNLQNAAEAAENWLASNRREASVNVTASGLQYRIERASPNPTGKRYSADQSVTVHYEGRLIDGTVFDSSFERGRPETLNPAELIQGWQEALSLMQPGDEWTLFIPPALAYGDLGRGSNIPPNAALIFKVQLR